jgi:hypothetical protein
MLFYVNEHQPGIRPDCVIDGSSLAWRGYIIESEGSETRRTKLEILRAGEGYVSG